MEKGSAATSVRPQNRHLKSYKPGQSGNPSGLPGGSKRNRLLDQFRAELGELSAIDDALLMRAIDSLCMADRQTVSAADRVKALNSARRILEDIRARQKVKADADSDGDTLAIIEAMNQ